MRRGRVVVRRRGPLSTGWDQLEPRGRQSGGRDKLIRRPIKQDAIEPDDVLVVVRELGVVEIVRRRRVCLQMPMHRRPGMVGVSLMYVLRRQPGQAEVRHENQAENHPTDGTPHVPVIMVAKERCIKQGPLAIRSRRRTDTNTSNR